MLGLVIYTVVLVVLFIICRELVCWYWKINEHLVGQRRLAEEIAGLRSDLNQANSTVAPTPTPVVEDIARIARTVAAFEQKPVDEQPKVVEVTNECPNCGAPYRLSDYREDAEITCSKCKEPLTQTQ
jgi:ribosomal protein S27AE